MQTQVVIQRSVRNWTLFFIIALILSGVTAFALETELGWLDRLFASQPSALAFWIHKVYVALCDMNQRYPFMAYGYDWLAFAHLVIAVAFTGVLKDPVKNSWIIQFGRIACVMIFPLALIAGPVRSIPFYWQLIDCSFGVTGLIPLTIVYNKIKKLETFNHTSQA